jgi:hypothetical protein
MVFLMKFYQDRCVWWITKFGNFDHFLWDKPKLFPYPSVKFGGFEIGGKFKIQTSSLLTNLSVDKKQRVQLEELYRTAIVHKSLVMGYLY